MPILFKNETKISEDKVKRVQKYAKIHKTSLIDIFKISICIFIIICSLILFSEEKITIIYILFALWRIKDTIEQINPKIDKAKLIYRFYEEYLEVVIGDMILEIEYGDIQNFIKEDDLYFIILKRCGFFIDRNSFVIGTDEELLNFIKSKITLEKIKFT